MHHHFKKNNPPSLSGIEERNEEHDHDDSHIFKLDQF